MRKVILFLIIFSFPTILWAADPIIGTWKLNVEKSKFQSNDSMVPKEMTETYRELSNGQIELSVNFISKDGSSDLLVMTYPIQGGVAKIQKGNPPGSYIQTRISPFEWQVTSLHGDTQVGTRLKKISKDGKTIQHISRYFDDKGKPVEQLLVFEKQ